MRKLARRGDLSKARGILLGGLVGLILWFLFGLLVYDHMSSPAVEHTPWCGDMPPILGDDC